MGKNDERENQKDLEYIQQRRRDRRGRQRIRRRQGNSGDGEHYENIDRNGQNISRPECNEKARTIFQKWTENRKPNNMNPFKKFTGTDNVYHRYPDDNPVNAHQGQLVSSDPLGMGDKAVKAVMPQSTVTTHKRTRTESGLSSISSSSSGSASSAVRSLEKAVEKSLQAAKTAAEQTNEKPSVTAGKSTDNSVGKQHRKIKAERPSKSDTSSTSSSSSSSSSSSTSSEDENPREDNTNGRDDVVCLGQLEKFENLVDDEEKGVPLQCGLCDKSDHISLHCQTICKNCNAKHHGLKDCPKPANLSIVFSNFMQFCLRQSVRYNPNEAFSVDEELKLLPSLATSHKALLKRSEKESGKRKRRSHKKRGRSSTSASSDSQSDCESLRERKRRSAKSNETAAIAAAGPFAQAFGAPYGFNVPGAVNPLLALSQLMGLGQAQMSFQNNSVAKD